MRLQVAQLLFQASNISIAAVSGSEGCFQVFDVLL